MTSKTLPTEVVVKAHTYRYTIQDDDDLREACHRAVARAHQKIRGYGYVPGMTRRMLITHDHRPKVEVTTEVWLPHRAEAAA